MAVHDPTRDIQRFDAYRAALRDAVGAATPEQPRVRTLTVHSLRRRRHDKTAK
jgi:hypothetical protein